MYQDGFIIDPESPSAKGYLLNYADGINFGDNTTQSELPVIA
jgi:hypothetical protein